MGQFRKKHLQHGLGSQRRNTPARSAKAGFHAIGTVTENRQAQVGDDAAAQARQVAVKVDQNVAGSEANAVVHRRAFAQHGAGHHAGTGLARQPGRIVNRAVVNHDHFCRGRVSQCVSHHVCNALCLVERRNHNRCVRVQRQPSRDFPRITAVLSRASQGGSSLTSGHIGPREPTGRPFGKCRF